MSTAERLLDPADLINFDSLLSAEELALRGTVRGFVKEHIKPNIANPMYCAVCLKFTVAVISSLFLFFCFLCGFKS